MDDAVSPFKARRSITGSTISGSPIPASSTPMGALGVILLPEQSQRHAAPLQLRMDVRPVRLGARRRRRRIRRRKQPPLQLAIIDLVRERPAQTRYGRATHVLADRRLADPRRFADNPPASPSRASAAARRVSSSSTLSPPASVPPGCQGVRSADSNVDGSALCAITCCPQSPDCCPPCAGIGVRVAPDSARRAGPSLRCVVALLLIPKKSGHRVKTNRRDVTMLACLHRAGRVDSRLAA